MFGNSKSTTTGTNNSNDDYKEGTTTTPFVTNNNNQQQFNNNNEQQTLDELPSSHNNKGDQASDEMKTNIIASILDWSCSWFIGFLVVSYWRGTWVLMDIYLCNQPLDASLMEASSFCFASDFSSPIRIRSAYASYGIGVGLLVIGVLISLQGVWFVTGGVVTKTIAFKRTVLVYILGAATVNIWRGIWYLTDAWIWNNSIETSMILTTLIGLLCCFMIGCGASLLAPPAIFLLDGPGYSAPPIAGTILETYYEITLPEYETMPKYHIVTKVADIALSFLVLPIFVVFFWRGCWGVLDIYLWGFVPEQKALHASLGYGAILAIVGIFVGSKDTISFYPKVTDKYFAEVLGKLRTVIMGVGTVSFWRLVWYIWDEFLGKSNQWSAWLSHVIGVSGLLCIGGLSCITAPPSTIGCDAVAHPQATKEPLFHDVPVPAESLYFMSICRQPKTSFQDSSQNPFPSRRHSLTSSFHSANNHQSNMSNHAQDDFSNISMRNLRKRNHSLSISRSR